MDITKEVDDTITFIDDKSATMEKEDSITYLNGLIEEIEIRLGDLEA